MASQSIRTGKSGLQPPLSRSANRQTPGPSIERCLNEIVRRHEVLRTNFSDNVVANRSKSFAESHSRSAAHRPESFACTVNERPKRSVKPPENRNNLSIWFGELCCATRLYRLDEQDHLLLFVTHHIVFDGWSDGVLLGEIATLYEAIIDGSPAPLTDLPIQYADYATGNDTRREESFRDTDLSYWKQQLNDSIPLLNLPTDRPRPAVRTYRGARKVFPCRRFCPSA